MLKSISKKSVLLLSAVMALCAFALPSMAPAASWSPVGTTDGVLDSGDISFTSGAPLNTGLVCPDTRFTVTVDSAAAATITGATFNKCHGLLGSSTGCTVTATGTGFPWRATAQFTTDIRIHDIHIDVRFETTPPANSTACANNGVNLSVTGTLGRGPTTMSWDVPQKILTFLNASGLTAHVAGAPVNAGIAVNGRAQATGLLNLLD